MEPDLRFDSRHRWERMLQAALTVVVATIIAAPGLIILLVTHLLMRPLQPWRSLKENIDGWIALIWYAFHAFAVNWPDLTEEEKKTCVD